MRKVIDLIWSVLTQVLDLRFRIPKNKDVTYGLGISSVIVAFMLSHDGLGLIASHTLGLAKVLAADKVSDSASAAHLAWIAWGIALSYIAALHVMNGLVPVVIKYGFRRHDLDRVENLFAGHSGMEQFRIMRANWRRMKILRLQVKTTLALVVPVMCIWLGILAVDLQLTT